MANKNIKGLTVEIGGDTTKLGKALEAVEKRGRDLSSELGEINRLLKLDPGNTELVAQKQKVLADAVENTKKRLDTLKEAEAQVQKQFERGEVSEDQVRALQREIITATKKLDSYEKAVSETADALEKMGTEADGAEDDIGKARKGADKASKALDDLADSADNAGEAGDGMGSKLAGAAKGGLAAVAAGAAAAIGALVGSAEATREYRTEMGKLDTAFTTNGFSSEAATKTYQTLQGVLGETEQAVEAANHLAKLTTTEEELAKWTDIATGVYATFGASLPIEGLTEAANETAKVGQVTGPLADALNWAGVSEDAFNESLAACTTEQERQALIMETLNGLYSEAAAKYKETNAEVIRANEANEAWMATMAEAGAAVEPILTDVKLLGASLLSDLMPGIVGVTDAFRGLINGESGAADALGTALSGLLTQLLDRIVGMLPSVAAAAVSLVTSLVTTVISMLPQLVQTGVQIIVALINGAMTAIPQIVLAIASVIPQLVQALTNGIPEIVFALVNGLIGAIPQLLTGAVQFLMAIVQAIPVIINALVPQIPLLVTAIVSGLTSNIPILLQGAIQLLHAIVEAIPIIITSLVIEIPTIVDTMTTELAKMAPVLLAAAIKLLWEIIKAVPRIHEGIRQNFPKIIQAILSIMSALPSLLWKIFTQVIGKVGQWIAKMTSKAGEVGSKFINRVVSFFKELPGKIATLLTNVINRVATWGTNLVSRGRKAASDLVTAVVNGVKALPGKLANIGRDLVEGLWNGITGMGGWLKDKVGGFAQGVLDKITNVFDSHSPSRAAEWIGETLPEGLAVGVENEADLPIKAVTDLSNDMLGEAGELDGLTLERRMNHTFGADPAATQAEGMLSKLDKIYQAILSGQVIMLDGKTLIGSTADGYDSRLGQRRVLAERGAI